MFHFDSAIDAFNRYSQMGITIEGVNNMIKLLRRTRYGRAKIELINAVAVLSSIDKFKYIDYVAVKHRCAAKPKLGCSDRAA